MQFFTPSQCQAWAKANRYSFEEQPHYTNLESNGFRVFDFKIPEDAGARVALARLLWESVAQDQPSALLWITAWGIWPSGEHMPLARAVRERFGETRPLIEAPGTRFELGEDAEGMSLWSLSILFLWDAFLLASGGEAAVFISHDEYGVVLTRSLDAALPIERRLGAFFGLNSRGDS